VDYLFQRYGSAVVFFGRFVTVLRTFAAFFAGESRMPWRRFALSNAAGGIIWATSKGLLGFELGASFTGPAGIVSIIVALTVVAAGFIVLQRNIQRLERKAEQAIPGPLDAYHRSTRKEKRDHSVPAA
jgi:membrane protein DedA with SNARE-associated domain